MFTNEYHVYVDGSLDSKGSGAGVIVWHPYTGQLTKHSIPLGELDGSTHAEIHALVQALELFKDRPDVQLELFSDSKPAISCLRGQTDVYKAREIQERAQQLIGELRRVRFHYMPAKTCFFSLEADNLAKQAVSKNKSIVRRNRNGIAILD